MVLIPQPREKSSPELVPGVKSGLTFYSLSTVCHHIDGPSEEVKATGKEQLPPLSSVS